MIPEKRYERNMNHNYLILSSYHFFGNVQEEGYMTKMLLGNKIAGLIPVICRQNAGEKQYCYEINSLQALDRLYEKQEIGYEALHKLLTGCVRIFERLEEYLLDGSQILLQPEFVYLHMDTNEPFFVCYPDYDGDVRKSFQKLVDYLLTKIDHTQEQAVWLAYQVYRYTRNPNFVLSEVKTLLYEAQEMREDREPKDKYDSVEKAVLEKERYQKSSELNAGNRDYFYMDEEEENTNQKGENENRAEEKESHEWNKNVLGALLCMLLALSAVGIIFGARLLKLIPLSQKQEVSLYGAIGMSVVAAGIFFVSILKKWRQEEQIQELSEEAEEKIEYWEQDEKPCKEVDISKESANRDHTQANALKALTGQHTVNLSGATTLLSQELMQEHCLKGIVNGEEVQIPLKHFPLTLGKLAEYCDFVIPDNTVSRMHVRLEQRDGQVYISDLNSTNGTIRNGDMLGIHEEVAMDPGDQIVLGRVCFTYC